MKLKLESAINIEENDMQISTQMFPKSVSLPQNFRNQTAGLYE